MLPATSTLLDTVMMAARAAILPDGVSTVTSRPFQATRFAGVDSASGKLPPSLVDQRAQALAAADRIGAVLRVRPVHRGNVLQILAGGIGAEHEFRCRGPVAEIFGQRGGAWHIGLAARGVVDGAVGADESCEKFLGFAGARVATADADFLTRGRRGDVEPGIARELDHRVGVGIVQPARAAIERRVEGRAIGETAAADPGRRLDHDHLAVCGLIRRAAAMPAAPAPITTMSASRGNGAPRTRAERRLAAKRSGRRQKIAARHCHVMVSEILKKTGTLIRRFKILFTLAARPAKLSEPKPHGNHRFSVSFPSEFEKQRGNDPNFAFGTW